MVITSLAAVPPILPRAMGGMTTFFTLATGTGAVGRDMAGRVGKLTPGGRVIGVGPAVVVRTTRLCKPGETGLSLAGFLFSALLSL